MISFGPFRAEHLSRLQVQDAQRWTLTYLTPDIMMGLTMQQSNTVFKDGHPILCGGVIEQRPDYGILWSFVGQVGPHDFFHLHRLARLFIRSLPYRRLEMHVDCEFVNGHRWARALGFRCEAPRMRAFLLNGLDAALYARING